MKVAVIQHDICWEDGPATCARLEPSIASAAAGGARLVVLSEMFATGFSMRPDVVGERPGGPNEQFLTQQAQQHGIWLIGSIAQWLGDQSSKAGNVAVLASPEGQTHWYQKIHPFSYGGEDKQYSAGTEFLTVLVEGVRITVFVCYDLRFGDEFWQLANDTDLYIVPANWPEARREHWQALLKARAIENLAYVIGCNRVGVGDDISYAGDSVILDPRGRALAQASQIETILTADIDPHEVEETRKRFGFLVDRR